MEIKDYGLTTQCPFFKFFDNHLQMVIKIPCGVAQGLVRSGNNAYYDVMSMQCIVLDLRMRF